MKKSILPMLMLSVFSVGCLKIEAQLPFQGAEKSSSNRVNNKNKDINALIGDEKVQFQVLSEEKFNKLIVDSSILTSTSTEGLSKIAKIAESNVRANANLKVNTEIQKNANSLIVGLPIGLLNQENIFGGVITKVTDKDNENLGTLKLTDLSPIHVKTIATMIQGRPALVLVGCAGECSETSEQGALLAFPIKGIDQESEVVYVDFAPIGKELDLISMLDPKGEYTQLKALSSETVNLEYDVSTLVFDIKTKMIPVSSTSTDPNQKTTDFTVRWYLKLSSGFNSYFESRKATEGVGFFTTERSATEKIARFSTTDYYSNVKYYVKHVPTEWKPVFAKAFDNWNKEFNEIIGRDLLSYEFIDKTDPRSELIVAGDIRYNVMEWDLDNIAGYGGLGPSIANQVTGEIISANVLIQGPTIVSLYKQWFTVSGQATELIKSGNKLAADKLMADFNKAAAKELKAKKNHKFSLKLAGLEMNVQAQRPELEDPIKKGHFELIPAGVTYKSYMEGYFAEMLEHELGHNLGLRHNFKGNLGATNTNETGSVSRSIMEYLGRGFRHLNAIGDYDRMAIAYGYRGVTPANRTWFCTDEDEARSVSDRATKSPECTKADATNDPFSFWESRLDRAIDMIVNLKSNEAPVWKTEEVQTQVVEATTGMLAYAASAKLTAKTWTNFFGKLDRPESAEGVKAYVLEAINKKLCDSKIAEAIEAKIDNEAKELAQKNLSNLSLLVKMTSLQLSVYSPSDISCK